MNLISSVIAYIAAAAIFLVIVFGGFALLASMGWIGALVAIFIIALAVNAAIK